MDVQFKVGTVSYKTVDQEGAEPILIRKLPGKGGVWMRCDEGESKLALDSLQAVVASLAKAAPGTTNVTTIKK